jgi:hypothetical protein
MAGETPTAKTQPNDREEPKLPLPWEQIQSAIWLIGLAILFWQGWFWPGILVLTAISGVSQALMQWTVQRQKEQRQARSAARTGCPANAPSAARRSAWRRCCGPARRAPTAPTATRTSGRRRLAK